MKKGFALVTGSSKGLGKAIAIELSRDGWDLILHYNSGKEAVTEVDKLCRDQGSETMVIQGDLSSIGGIDSTCTDIRNMGIRLKGIVNNAGISLPGNISTITQEAWERVLDVNLRAPVFIVNRLSGVIEKPGSVVNISSAAAIKAGLSAIAYEASKAALVHATRSMAVTLAPGIRVNSVAPGFVKTDINRKRWEDRSFYESISKATLLGRWGNPEDVAKAVRFLMSEDASYITGETLVVDGGITLR
ncbi:SDR family NAD(P)-dependent oxidoreductase [Oxyplasma meridianum]|uniref:SDR family NAD(P)-dependent oxidoreductase n=1 Tax=Oxyplasma meridianum TaxID=3073602 RepID=A0AAX4NHY6_9ARCH